MKVALPNFFVLGAAKAGTTTLHAYLTRHPEIYLSSVKEPQFFCHEELYRRGVPYYLETFFQGSDRFAVRGEATPHYLYYEKVARRLASDLPRENLRFVVMLRDPVARAYSLYWNMVAEGVETLSFEDALRAESQRKGDPALERRCAVSVQYVDSGLYAKQVHAYLKYFDRRQFLYVVFEEFTADPLAVLNEICTFLDVSPYVSLPAITKTNAAGFSRSQVLQSFLRGSSRLKKAIGWWFPQHLKYRIVENLLVVNRRRTRYPPIATATAVSLRACFAADVAELERLTGKSFAQWRCSRLSEETET